MGKDVGFLFDNDGVLIDSTEFHWQAWVAFMQEEKRLHMTRAQFIQGFGKRNDLILKDVAPFLTSEEIVLWAQRKEALFREIAKDKIELLPGMERFLQEVQKYPHIIASSTPLANLKLFLERTPLGKYFEKFVSAEEVPHGKPFPDVFLEAASRLDLPPDRCIVIEDAPAGVVAGKRAGCKVVALGTTHKKEELMEADLFYSSPQVLNLAKIISLLQ